MSSNQNNKNDQSFINRLKELKVKKATVITSVVVLAALAVVISVTIASNRTKDRKDPPAESDPPISESGQPDESQPSESESEKESETSKPDKPTVSKPVQDKVPSLILPVSGTLSTPHDPELQVYSPTLKDWRVHLGIDIVTKDGASVYSAADGTVAKVWKDDMMGYSIAVKHSGDCYTFYQNLSDKIPESIKEGASIRSGQLIGTVGDSALVEVAAEPHLHFEMTVADLEVDPLKYFSEDAIKSLTKDSSYE